MPLSTNESIDKILREPYVIELDLSDYCEKILRYNEQLIASINNPTSVKIQDALRDSALTVNTLRENFIHQYVSGFQGAIISNQIIEYFSPDLGLDIEDTLAVHCFHLSFVEFLKNSMDAIIIRCLHGDLPIEDAVLTMSITITRDDSEDKLNIYIEDNAGGFPENYLHHFQENLDGKSYLGYGDQHISDKDKTGTQRLLFGGQGRGMSSLYALLLDGKEVLDTQQVDKYDVPVHSSGIQIFNRTDGVSGASIAFYSSLSPVQEAVLEEQESPKLNLSNLSMFSFSERRRSPSGLSPKTPSSPDLTDSASNTPSTNAQDTTSPSHSTPKR